MNKKMKKIIGVTVIAAAGMHVINRIIDYTAGLKELMSTDNGEIYEWNNGSIFYEKYGKGSPILLIHDLNPASSLVEWSKVMHKLGKNHTVYAIDLIGCGRSEKPGITYTNFLYVQLINNFIRDVIGEEADIITTGFSASFVIMAQAMNKENFRKIILINPSPLDYLKAVPQKNNRIVKFLFELPILGTFLYNISVHEKKIHEMFEKKFFCKKSLISAKLEDIYFESAHKDKSMGKYLQASMQSNFINVDITDAVKNSGNLYLIASRERNNAIAITEDYLHINKNIEVSYISNSKYLPQLEVPEKFLDVVKNCLDD